jgi:hypothetical protein
MADAVEPPGQDVKQEAADELVRLERHDLLALRADAAIVLVSEAHARFVD